MKGTKTNVTKTKKKKNEWDKNEWDKNDHGKYVQMTILRLILIETGKFEYRSSKFAIFVFLKARSLGIGFAICIFFYF